MAEAQTDRNSSTKPGRAARSRPARSGQRLGRAGKRVTPGFRTAAGAPYRRRCRRCRPPYPWSETAERAASPAPSVRPATGMPAGVNVYGGDGPPRVPDVLPGQSRAVPSTSSAPSAGRAPGCDRAVDLREVREVPELVEGGQLGRQSGGTVLSGAVARARVRSARRRNRPGEVTLAFGSRSMKAQWDLMTRRSQPRRPGPAHT